MMSTETTKIIKRFALLSFMLSLLAILLLIVFFQPVSAQTDYIIDQESYTYSGTLTLVNHSDFYSNSARMYTGTVAYYATYSITGVAASDYDLYAWIRQGASYGAMRYTVDDLYLDTLDFSSLPDGWNLVGSITISEPDTDPPYLVIDRADTGSGNLVADAIKLVLLPTTSTTTTAITTTIAYTLPTTGDAVLYHREVAAGDLMIAAAGWALVILFLVREIWHVARGEG